ncbi:hypothetical protein, partial [Roseibium sp.]|uniref:hypothetical protein n=1 Tax=Roseibium sp. TaxID=1936156 RepID=UPI0025F9C34E
FSRSSEGFIGRSPGDLPNPVHVQTGFVRQIDRKRLLIVSVLPDLAHPEFPDKCAESEDQEGNNANMEGRREKVLHGGTQPGDITV